MVATQGSGRHEAVRRRRSVGTNPQTQAQGYTGYWRVGGDNTWGGASSDYFAGTIDEVAVYSTVLTPAQIADALRRLGGVAPNQPPTAAFTSTRTDLTLRLRRFRLDRHGRHDRVVRVGLR